MAFTSPKTYSSGAVLTAADLNTYQRDNMDAVAPDGVQTRTFTPTLTASTTSPTLGSGSTASGVATMLGNLAVVHIYVAFGSSGTNAGSGNYLLNWAALPSDFDAHATLVSSNFVTGSGYVRDSSAGDYWTVSCVANNSTSVRMVYTNATDNLVTDSLPHAWAANDSMKICLSYVVA